MTTAKYQVQTATAADISGIVGLQRACFPPPFPQDQLWQAKHIEAHLRSFPNGQLVATWMDQVVGSASNLIIPEHSWLAHRSWSETVGGPELAFHDPDGTTLYGVDISVHPNHRRHGVGRQLYEARYELVCNLSLIRYGTACRMPGYRQWSEEVRGRQDPTHEQYASLVAQGALEDRTLSPLLRLGLTYLGVIRAYMPDLESGDAAALLEWMPR